MKKKIFLTIFLLIVLFTTYSFASYSTVTMSVVEEPVCTIELGDNSFFEKKLVEKNLNNKEVTLQLQVTNNELATVSGEIMLVLDNSDSMQNQTSTGEIRKDLVFESAKTLVSRLLENNTELEIGVVSFSTNTDQSKEATIEDATLVSDLTNDVSTLTNAISNIEANGPRTDLEAGLSLVSSQFSEEADNKYMIVLTDGVPNVGLGSNNPYYSDTTITQTKEELQSLAESNIQVITMLTGIDDEDYVPVGVQKSFGQIIEEIFGTPDQPTVGSFYYITDDQIEETITNDIYNNLVPDVKTLTNIVIKDYFPEEIVQNFDFAYITESNVGEISAQIDTSDNSITWTIPELSSGKTAIVQYTLKLKENFDSSIVGEILDTNERVDITYNDYDNVEQSKTSDVTPKLLLEEPPAVLPKAGTTILIGFAILASGLLIFSIVRLAVINNKMKH